MNTPTMIAIGICINFDFHQVEVLVAVLPHIHIPPRAVAMLVKRAYC